jgi:hypothetical protein
MFRDQHHYYLELKEAFNDYIGLCSQKDRVSWISKDRAMPKATELAVDSSGSL